MEVLIRVKSRELWSGCGQRGELSEKHWAAASWRARQETGFGRWQGMNECTAVLSVNGKNPSLHKGAWKGAKGMSQDSILFGSLKIYEVVRHVLFYAFRRSSCTCKPPELQLTARQLTATFFMIILCTFHLFRSRISSLFVHQDLFLSVPTCDKNMKYTSTVAFFSMPR